MQLLYITLIVLIFVGLRFTPWGHRTAAWLTVFFGKSIKDDVPTFSDFLTFTAFSLSVVGIFLGWYSLNLSGRKTNLERRQKELEDSIVLKTGELSRLLLVKRQPEEHSNEITIEVPAPNSRLLGDTVDLHWSYSRHTERHSYLVQVIRRQPNQVLPGSQGSRSCDLDTQPSCTFIASDPAAQRMRLSHIHGDFLWRVVPIKSIAGIPARSPARVELSDWSEFGSFSIYPNVADRLLEEGLLVGTVYTNPNFSTVDEHGHASGHDIDLVRLLVWGCLKVNSYEHTVAYDEESCTAATSLYATVAKQLVATRRVPVPATLVRQEALDFQDDWIKKASAADPRRRIKVRIRSFPNLETALLELSRKQIDVLIGSITKASKRLSDNDNIRFTDGYYSFETRLYAREGSAQRAAQWTDWLRTSRRVGVISNSTNHWLANALSEEAGAEQLDLKVVPFDSFSQLEQAFDRNDIDGVLIDNLLSDAQLERTVPLSGIEDTDAWRHYIKEQIGGDGEELALAVATSDKRECLPDKNSLMRVVLGRDAAFYLPISSNDIYCPIQQALRSDEIERTNAILRDVYNIPPPQHGPHNQVAVP